MKNLVKAIIFTIILCLILYGIFKVLWLGKTYVSNLIYDEPKNLSDIVYIGSSTVYTYFNPVLAYDLYGFTTCFCATGSQPFAAIKYLIKESQKYQTPELYIIDLATSIEDWDFYDEGAIRRSIDSMKFSKNRIDSINEILKYKGVDKKEYINYYFSFLSYHNSWKNLSKENFTENENSYKGYILSEESVRRIKSPTYSWTNNIEKISSDKEQILMDLLDYIKSDNLNVIFTIPIRYTEESDISQLNYVKKIIENSGYKVINFNDLDDFTVDYNKDFYNTSHVNVYGATKYTMYFSEYLKENYNLPNHKGDMAYSSWAEEYERLKENFNKLTGEDFNVLLYN